MATEKQKSLKRLKILYLSILILSIVLVLPPHLFPKPYFMPLRFPHYLEMMPPFLGFSWPMTFEIYHWTLLIIGAIGVINVLGLVFGNMKSIAKLSSLIGLFLFPLIILFLFLVFTSVNAITALIYGFYSVVLLITNVLTFKFLTKKQKEEAREAF